MDTNKDPYILPEYFPAATVSFIEIVKMADRKMNNIFSALFWTLQISISVGVAFGIISGDIDLPIPYWFFVTWLSVAILFILIPIFGKRDFKDRISFIKGFLLFSSWPVVSYGLLLYCCGYPISAYSIVVIFEIYVDIFLVSYVTIKL